MIAVVDGLLPGVDDIDSPRTRWRRKPERSGAARWRSEPARRPHPTRVGSAPIIAEQPRAARGVDEGDRAVAGGSCDDDADAHARRLRIAVPPLGRRRRRGRRRRPGPRPRQRPRRAAVDRRHSPSAGRSSRRSSCRSSPPAVGWLRIVRRIDRAHPAQPGAARADRRVPGGPRRDRDRAAVGDRRLRHDPLLGPHGPAPAADPRRGAADRPRRADHDAPPRLVARTSGSG